MNTVRELERRREAIFQQMRSIRSMQRGTVNEQYLKVPHKGRPEPALCGPYYVLTGKQAGRTVSRRLTDPEQLEQARADVAAHRRFVELCREFERLTEQLGQLQRRSGADQGKKRRS
jgi:hypothetical protein